MVLVTFVVACKGASRVDTDAPPEMIDAPPDVDGMPDAGVVACDAVPTFLDGFAASRILYVSPTGDDAADGLTPETAFASVRKAATQLVPGDEVRVAAGHYGCNVFVNVQATADHPVWIHSSDGPLQAVLDCGGTQYGVMFGQASYVALDGFDIGNTSLSHVVHVNSGPLNNGFPDHILITHNHLHHAGLTCIKMSGGWNVDVIDNELDHSQDQGPQNQGQLLDMVGAQDVRVIGNRLHDVVDQPGIQAKGGSTDVLIDRNVVTAADGGINLGGVTAPDSFYPPDADYEGLRVVATNNVLVSTQVAAAFWGCHDCAFTNNSVVMTDPHQPVRFHNGTTPTGGVSTVQNPQLIDNLFSFATRPQDLLNATPLDNAATLVQSHNLFYCATRPIAEVFSDIPVGDASTGTLLDVDPQLTDPESGDLTLQPSSPALDTGIAVPGVTHDALGECRTTWNIGAY